MSAMTQNEWDDGKYQNHLQKNRISKRLLETQPPPPPLPPALCAAIPQTCSAALLTPLSLAGSSASISGAGACEFLLLSDVCHGSSH